MVLNAQAIRELKNIDEEVRCEEYLTVSRRAFDVARRALNLALSDGVRLFKVFNLPRNG